MKPLVALCIGHSRKISGRIEGGAVSVDGTTNEHTYNTALAVDIAAHLRQHGVESVTVDRYEGSGYGASQRWLAAHLRDIGATVAIELHFNSATPAANGHEWLYWGVSSKGRKLADSLNAEMVLACPAIRSRGIKPKYVGDRGAEFLRGTHCPACIAEPFFGSNASDWQIAISHRRAIGIAIAEGILGYLD